MLEEKTSVFGGCAALALAVSLFASGAASVRAASVAPADTPAASPSAPAPAGSASAGTVSPAPAASGNAAVAQFDTEVAAQTHCPHDKVVWLSLKTNYYYYSDSIWFGKTKRGTYVCHKEADAAGDHESNYGMTTHKSI